MTPLASDSAGRPRIRTTVGVTVGTRPRLSPEARRVLRRKLERGPFLARFIAGYPVHLVGEIWLDGERSLLVAEDAS